MCIQVAWPGRCAERAGTLEEKGVLAKTAKIDAEGKRRGERVEEEGETDGRKERGKEEEIEIESRRGNIANFSFEWP